MSETGFRFLYREDRGRIGRATWWRGTAPLVIGSAVATLVWVLVKPYAAHDLATQPFIDAATILAFLYLALYSFGLIIAAVCQYNVSAKRFRDRGRPGALAAILPLAVFFAGALLWFIPRSFGEAPEWTAPVALSVVVLVAAWNVWDLGFGDSQGSRP